MAPRDVVCLYFPEAGPPRLVRETWDDVPFERTEYIWLTDRRANLEELGLLGRQLSRNGFHGFDRWLKQHTDDVKKCEDERDPKLVPLMTYWTVLYDEEALLLSSKTRANRALGGMDILVMGDAYVVMNVEKLIGSRTTHLIDMDLLQDPFHALTEVARTASAK